MQVDFFPQSLASGVAFCNRVKEKNILKNNILKSRPTLIVSPRRYGKTSLALQAIHQTKLSYAQFDFLAAVSPLDLETIILKGIGRMIYQLEKNHKKALNVASEFFAQFNIQLKLGPLGVSIELDHKSRNSSQNILDVLERLEQLAKKYQKKIVLFFDEFQRMRQVSEDQVIEAHIRQVAQRAQALSFVFSGSNRHILNNIFSDRDKPLYKLCDRLTLERISEQDYRDYFQMVARKTGVLFEPESAAQVFYYSKRHPYYVNLLCARLWSHQQINSTLVEQVWCDYAFEERAQVANELDGLRQSQRKLLAALARTGGTSQPRGHAFAQQADMPGTTITQALAVLLRGDYIYQRHSDGVYVVLDPLIEHVLAHG